MKKLAHNSIIVSLHELNAINTTTFKHRVIKETEDPITRARRSNVAAWNENYIVEFPSEATRNAYFKEIAYHFCAIGFWQNIRAEASEMLSNNSGEDYTEEELMEVFESAKHAREEIDRRIKTFGIETVLAELDREWQTSWGVSEDKINSTEASK